MVNVTFVSRSISNFLDRRYGIAFTMNQIQASFHSLWEYYFEMLVWVEHGIIPELAYFHGCIWPPFRLYPQWLRCNHLHQDSPVSSRFKPPCPTSPTRIPGDTEPPRWQTCRKHLQIITLFSQGLKLPLRIPDILVSQPGNYPPPKPPLASHSTDLADSPRPGYGVTTASRVPESENAHAGLTLQIKACILPSRGLAFRLLYSSGHFSVWHLLC